MEPPPGNTARDGAKKGKGKVSRGSSSATGNTSGNRESGESSANSGQNSDRPLGRSFNLASNPSAEQAGEQWQCQLPLPFPLIQFSCGCWNEPNAVRCKAPEKNPFKPPINPTNPGENLGCGRQKIEGFWTLGSHINRLNLYYRKRDQIPEIDWVVLKDGTRVRCNEER
ncbi:hypothetical protein BCON_0033g00010 [Botryotinia convoluta]|uniref:Uncharacterized protein n=1 Tax=Botryotinia convoluta TaxID=54673 RepID=A0A4Z1IGC7_9HELO|nr:hypothetical protein BCON_0033g00010 [Botryotinia convoluta]